MNTKIRVELKAMSESEIISMVPPRVLASIKAENHHPVFKTFCIGEEGQANPSLVGIGPVVQHWFKSAIQALGNKLRIGTPAFNLHAPTNEQAGRPAIGEVIGKAVEKIKDAVRAIAVIYIYPEFQDLKLDVASIEADVVVPSGTKKQEIEDDDIMDVTAIALGNRDVNKPAFPGAGLLATLQAFAENTPKGDHIMTLEEIKKAIQEGRHSLTDLFTVTQLVSDPFIKEHVEEKVNNAKGYDIRKRQDLEKKVETLETENKTLQGELASYKSSVIGTKAKETFEAVLAERPKLNEDKRLSKFIRSRYDKDFKPGEEAKLRDELNKFVDGQVTEFQELFGDTKPEKEKEPTKPVVDVPKGDADLEDMRKNNDLIP